MIKNSKRSKSRARLTAILMSLALAVPQAVVPPSIAASTDPVAPDSGTDSVSGSAVTASAASAKNAEELRSLIKKNLVKDYDVAKSGEMDIVHEERSRDAADMLTFEAQTLQANAGDRPAKYQIYDIDQDQNAEMFIQWTEKKKSIVPIHRYDDTGFTTAFVEAFSNVTELHKNTKKKQIVVVSDLGKNKKVIATYKLTASGKLKTVSEYKQAGKKIFKKGSKKITKKAFDKQYKTVKKLAKIKMTKIPETDYSNKIVDECFYGKDLYYRRSEDDLGQENFFMSKGVTGSASQDKCIAYSYAYDLVGWHEYSVDPILTRYVFGPDVVDKKTGKTYQEEDWEAFRKEVFCGQYAPQFLTESIGDDGKTILDIDSDSELHAVDAKDKEAKNGAVSYKGKEYTIEYGDAQLRMTFFTEGPLKDRIAEAGIYYPEVNGDAPHDKWTFIYGSEAGNPAEHDPLIYDCITAGGVTEGQQTRTLKIGAASDDLKQSIKVATNVRFELYGRGSGQFYTTSADGKETLLPIEDSTDDDGNSVQLSENDEAWVAFENALNPASGQMTFGDVDEKYLSWRAK